MAAMSFSVLHKALKLSPILFLAMLVLVCACSSQSNSPAKDNSEYAEVLKVDTPQAHEALAVALRVSQASSRLESRKLNEDMLRSLISVAFQGENVDIDSLIDLKVFLRVNGKHQLMPPPQTDTKH
jgi:hypothetical protein